MQTVEKDVERFLYSYSGPIFDVRAPCEFDHGSIPDSLPLPLFSDEERHLIGCCYKQKGKSEAIQLGLEYVGPKLAAFSKQFVQLGSPCRILCFRGGMRSSSMAWLATLVGCEVVRLEKGYKSYRKWVLEQCERTFPALIFSGSTGSGKTEILRLLQQKGYPVLDLEGIAKHRGSVFGGFEETSQPTQEQFENVLAHTLYPLLSQKYVCVEAESRKVGDLLLPQKVYEAIHSGPQIVIRCSFEERLDRIVEEYGKKPKASLLHCIEKLRTRLGGAVATEALQHVTEDRLHDAASLLLQYYDKTYDHCKTKHTGRYTECSRNEVVEAIEKGTFDGYIDF